MATSGEANSIVASSKPKAIAFVIYEENKVTNKDKTIKKAINCKKITDENLILYFDFAYVITSYSIHYTKLYDPVASFIE